MTFSIVGRCVATGQFGMAISSSSPAVAARCAHVRAGVGVVASQNITDPELGSLTLDAMATGLSSDKAIAAVLKNYPYTDYLQLLAVDSNGDARCGKAEHEPACRERAGDEAIVAALQPAHQPRVRMRFRTAAHQERCHHRRQCDGRRGSP